MLKQESKRICEFYNYKISETKNVVKILRVKSDIFFVMVLEIVFCVRQCRAADTRQIAKWQTRTHTYMILAMRLKVAALGPAALRAKSASAPLFSINQLCGRYLGRIISVTRQQ